MTYSGTVNARYSRTSSALNSVAFAPDPAELVQIEEVTGLRYGRKELTEIDALIARADALLDGNDPDFHRPFVAALRAFFGAVDRPGTEE